MAWVAPPEAIVGASFGSCCIRFVLVAVMLALLSHAYAPLRRLISAYYEARLPAKTPWVVLVFRENGGFRFPVALPERLHGVVSKEAWEPLLVELNSLEQVFEARNASRWNGGVVALSASAAVVPTVLRNAWLSIPVVVAVAFIWQRATLMAWRSHQALMRGVVARHNIQALRPLGAAAELRMGVFFLEFAPPLESLSDEERRALLERGHVSSRSSRATLHSVGRGRRPSRRPRSSSRGDRRDSEEEEMARGGSDLENGGCASVGVGAVSSVGMASATCAIDSKAFRRDACSLAPRGGDGGDPASAGMSPGPGARELEFSLLPNKAEI